MTKKKPTFSVRFPEFVEILGTPWRVVVKNFDDDPYFQSKSACGYCSYPEHEIGICEEKTWPGHEDEDIGEVYCRNVMMRTLRHEIIHAFMHESGLSDSAMKYGGAWPLNEEMIDWFAVQGPKIYKVWQEANCLGPMDPEMWMEWKTKTEGKTANE